jgi:hypothetical protein
MINNTRIARRRFTIWKNHAKLQQLAGLKPCDWHTFKRYVFCQSRSEIQMYIKAAELAAVIKEKQYNG